MLLMQRDSKNNRLGPVSVAGSYVSNRSEGQKSLASLASMMSEKVTYSPPSPVLLCHLSVNSQSQSMPNMPCSAKLS